MSNLRQQIITKAKVPSRRFTPDGFPCEVEVRGMNGSQRAAYVEFVGEAKASGIEIFDLREFYPMLVIGHVYDPADGSVVFTDGDKDAVLGLPGAALEQIAKEVQKLSGLGPKAEAEARDVSSEANEATTTTSPNA